MLFYSISVHVKNYKAEELLQSIESISQQIRKNKNCLDLKIYKDLENSENYNILSTWNDEDSLRVFMKRNENKILEGAASVLGERVERKSTQYIQ